MCSKLQTSKHVAYPIGITNVALNGFLTYNVSFREKSQEEEEEEEEEAELINFKDRDFFYRGQKGPNKKWITWDYQTTL